MQRLWTKDYILGISINFLVMVNYYMLVVIMTDYALKFYDVSVTIAGLTASPWLKIPPPILTSAWR